MRVAKLILWRPKLLLDVECPRCHSIDIKGVPRVETKCKNCHALFNTEAGVNIYGSIAKKLNHLLRHYDQVSLVGGRDSKSVYTIDEVFSPKSKHEDDIIHCLLAIKRDFSGMGCWEVSEIENSQDTDWKSECIECGVCNNCVTCIKCKTTYTPKTVDTREGKQKRFKCPECQSRKHKSTHIKKFEKSGECPYCNSENIMMSKFASVFKECPYCKTKRKTPPRKLPVYKLIITRQKRNIKDEN